MVGTTGPPGSGLAELFDHDREFGEPVPRAAVLLREVDPEQALRAEVGEERRALLDVRLEPLARVGEDVGVRRPATDRVRQGAVLLGQRDGHD